VSLTKRAIDGLEQTDTRYFAWDDDPKGFGVRVAPGGRKTFVVDYVTESGRRRRPAIGVYGELTVDQARKKARRILAAVSDGADPLAEKQEKRSGLTVKEFSELYTKEMKPKKRPASQRMDEMNLRLHILPNIKSLKIADVNRQDVASMHSKMSDKPVQANRVLALLSHMLNTAQDWGYRPEGTNPCRHVKKYKEETRERYLTPDELKTLGEVLKAKEAKSASCVRAVRLLLLTGMRRDEVLTLKWEYVDLRQCVINLPETKTGKRTVPLGGAAVRLLKDAPTDNEWVIPSTRRKGRHLVNLNDFWLDVREKAEIEDVRLHDLRHCFGSFGAQAGLSVPLVAGLLGHKEWRTSQRYAHVDPALAHAADLVSGEIAAALEGRETAQVVNIDRY